MQDEDKETMNSALEPSEEEKYKSFFDVDGDEGWDDDLEGKEAREKIKENKVKSLRERKRLGDKGDIGTKRFYEKR